MLIPAWAAFLPTRISAERAAKWGGLAFIIQAARLFLGIFGSASASGKPLDDAIAWTVGASVFPLLMIIGGWRLYKGAGWILAGLLALEMTVELLFSTRHPISIVVTAALLGLTLNGVRGVLAIQRVNYSKSLGTVFS
jgi:hypothetical protein